MTKPVIELSDEDLERIETYVRSMSARESILTMTLVTQDFRSDNFTLTRRDIFKVNEKHSKLNKKSVEEWIRKAVDMGFLIYSVLVGGYYINDLYTESLQLDRFLEKLEKLSKGGPKQ